MSDSPLSTSALAKALGKPTKQMFSELASLGWIKRSEDAWTLTTKGEFEGGSYRESPKFGRYIIWPPTVLEHAALKDPDALKLTTSKLARHFDMTRKGLDQLLQELGWVIPARKGWQLTPMGESEGGFQRENAATAIPFVLWPADMTDHPVLANQIDQLKNPATPYFCRDGHSVTNKAEYLIDNWLYYSGLLHAYQRPLAFAENLSADFYLPTCQVYIENWVGKFSPAELKKKLAKQTVFAEQHCRVIEVHEADLLQLDDYLSRSLLKFGIEV